MATGTVTVGASIGGVSFSGTITATGETLIGKEITPAAATSCTLTTRTGNDTGILTFVGSNPFSGAEVVDLTWTGGRRYGMIVSSVDALTATVGTAAEDVGEGDNLPTQSTTIYASVQTSDGDVTVVGNSVKMLVLQSDYNAQVTFRTSVPATIKHFDLTGGMPVVWVYASGITNPLASATVATTKVSSSTTSAATVKICAVVDTVA